MSGFPLTPALSPKGRGRKPNGPLSPLGRGLGGGGCYYFESD
ncbi:hypothetical protein AC00_2348 [Escherichia coli 1-250-04_S3_C1]|uniref:Uncharacterized protein n=1 Tax=Escherichia coli 1-250-04_S3_C1 TaxID=1444135 RepID=A0AAN4NTI9_ECOLX|nr:hypothetical protein AC00_2348 [Escherichia coli 1-250-04_S3_C1]